MPDLAAPAATAARAIAGVVVRHALTGIGGALVARGLVDQATASSAEAPIADYIVGLGLAIASASWGVLRARLTHTRLGRAWAALTAEDGQ